MGADYTCMGVLAYPLNLVTYMRESSPSNNKNLVFYLNT